MSNMGRDSRDAGANDFEDGSGAGDRGEGDVDCAVLKDEGDTGPVDAIASVGGLGISIVSSPDCDGLPTLPPWKDGGIGEEGDEWLGVELVGGLAEMRMLTSRESNIRRIRPFQQIIIVERIGALTQTKVRNWAKS